jgi:hypothetical protein
VIALTDRIGAAGDEDLVREIGAELGEVALDLGLWFLRSSLYRSCRYRCGRWPGKGICWSRCFYRVLEGYFDGWNGTAIVEVEVYGSGLPCCHAWIASMNLAAALSSCHIRQLPKAEMWCARFGRTGKSARRGGVGRLGYLYGSRLLVSRGMKFFRDSEMSWLREREPGLSSIFPDDADIVVKIIRSL